MVTQEADICLLLEGTYPYVAGGVSGWTHELIEAHKDLTFTIVALLPPNAVTKLHYPIPKNVLHIKNVFLQQIPREGPPPSKAILTKICQALQGPLLKLQTGPTLGLLQEVMRIVAPYRHNLGESEMLNSRQAWEMILGMYNHSLANNGFLDFFWSWRALYGGMYTVLLTDLPKAKVYHALCTGYTGFMLARAYLETGRPCMLTEHGIYTNERRIEIASADWIDDRKSLDLGIEIHEGERELRDFWIDTFASYSKLCYEACTWIITLFEGNKEFQIADGADPKKLKIIPNGVDIQKYEHIQRQPGGPPAIALIGRVVPIKDIKTYIRACDILRRTFPDLQAYIIGPTDENEEYTLECKEMVAHLGLKETVIFTGKVKVAEYLPKIDVIVLTSISEAQPLVILEAGAAGVPSVATDVGACEEMIRGFKNEDPPLGPGGAVSGLSNPISIANNIIPLLTDRELFVRCSEAMRKRVRTYYNKDDQHKAYRELYASLMAMGTRDFSSPMVQDYNVGQRVG